MQIVAKPKRMKNELTESSPPSVPWREEESGEAGGHGKGLGSEAKATRAIGEEDDRRRMREEDERKMSAASVP